MAEARLRDHGRFSYSAITRRPDFTWPDGRRLAVYLALNLEHFAFGEGLGAQLAPSPQVAPSPQNPSGQPDVLNYAWREYGNRVGAWRLLELFDELALPCGLLVNSALYDHCPDLLAAFRARGDAFVGHGWSNAERQGALDEAAERHLITRVTEEIARQEGHAPAGWLGPWISQSPATPDLLKEAGYRYCLDWCHDDQPVWMKTRAGPLLSLPYPQEINDIPAIAVRCASAADFAAMIVDQFDEMLDQSARQPLVMGIALHAYLIGQPFRLRHLRGALRHIAEHTDSRVWLATPDAIAAHAQGLAEGVLPPP